LVVGEGGLDAQHGRAVVEKTVLAAGWDDDELIRV
jgi:hypothetical protein